MVEYERGVKVWWRRTDVGYKVENRMSRYFVKMEEKESFVDVRVYWLGRGRRRVDVSMFDL